VAQRTEIHPPWYRQLWPWVLIAIPLSAVIMGGIALWLALANPDYLVVEEDEYDRIRSELRAQDPSREDQPAPEPGDHEHP
jgi:hypothetical protein